MCICTPSEELDLKFINKEKEFTRFLFICVFQTHAVDSFTVHGCGIKYNSNHKLCKLYEILYMEYKRGLHNIYAIYLGIYNFIIYLNRLSLCSEY